MEWNKLKEKLISSEYYYFHTNNGVLLCGDCLEIMKEFPDEFIDLILTDPPYNIADSNKLTKRKGKIKSNEKAWGVEFKDKWNSIEDYSSWLINTTKLLKKCLKNSGSIILFLDRTYIGYFLFLIEREVKLEFRNKIYFEKINPLPHFRKNNYRSCIEEAIWFTKGTKYYFNFLSQKEMRQIFKGSIGKRFTKHPTEKYEWMIEPLITRHSRENDLILDPFIGSGLTAVVCEKLNRRWIGIEINPEYCKITKQRILEYVTNS